MDFYPHLIMSSLLYLLICIYRRISGLNEFGSFCCILLLCYDSITSYEISSCYYNLVVPWSTVYYKKYLKYDNLLNLDDLDLFSQLNRDYGIEK